MPNYTSYHPFISCAVTFTLCSKVEAAAVHVRRRQVVHKGDSQSNIIYHRKSLPAPMSVHPSSETTDVKLSQPASACADKHGESQRPVCVCACIGGLRSYVADINAWCHHCRRSLVCTADDLDGRATGRRLDGAACP